MQSYSARLSSFSPPSRPKSLRWPHPPTYLATPASLASAGFFFSPSSETPDAVSCFLCHKGLADWDPHDDPALIHAQKCPKCPWALLRCVSDPIQNGSITFLSSSRLPTSRSMEKARLATFGPSNKSWWPHEAKSKGPRADTMAKAGFMYTPAEPKDDTCICIYCHIELGGWLPEDDPMEEHQKRQSKNGPCPFFTTQPQLRPSKSKHPSRPTKSKQQSRSTKSKHQLPPNTLNMSEIDDGPDSSLQPALNQPITKKTSKSLRSSKKSKPPDTLEHEAVVIEGDRIHPNPPSTGPLSASYNSFQSPEDEELAREEQALEEQARALMCADELPGVPEILAERSEMGRGKDGGAGRTPSLYMDTDIVVDPPVPPRPHPSTPPPPTPFLRTTNVTSTQPPSHFPSSLSPLTPSERAMTVEEWVRHEMERQFERLRSDGQRKIEAFKRRAQEVAMRIEGL